MTDELKDWFSHLATVEAEMRQDINRYMNPGDTPLNFAVRLRTHPKLSITAKAKMTSAVRATAAYGGLLVESRFFDVTPDGTPWMERNAAGARELIGRAAKHGIRTRSREATALFTGVPHEDVLDFLSSYSFHERSSDADTARISEYIRRRVRAGALGRWSVGVIGNSRKIADIKSCDLGNGVEVRMVRRSRIPHEGDGEFDGVADIKTLTSRRDEALDLDAPSTTGMSRKDLVELRRRQRPTEGLLLLYPIEPRSEPTAKRRVALEAPTDDVVMGVALVFPEPRGTGLRRRVHECGPLAGRRRGRRHLDPRPGRRMTANGARLEELWSAAGAKPAVSLFRTADCGLRLHTAPPRGGPRHGRAVPARPDRREAHPQGGRRWSRRDTAATDPRGRHELQRIRCARPGR